MQNRAGFSPTKVWIVAGVIAAIVVIGSAVLYLGLYDVGADAPQSRVVRALLLATRERSVAVRARGLEVPTDLDDSTRIAMGAGLYDDMCSTCHLAPGMERTEISQGLEPHAPELSRSSHRNPAQDFWIIKHGVKMTGMAAWGKTHADSLIWDMVGFLGKLHTLSPAQYQALVKSAPKDHDEIMKAGKP